MRLPVDEVGAFAVGKLWIVGLGRPYAAPHALAIAHEVRGEHLLLCTPGAEVAIHEGTSITDRCPVEAVRTVGKGNASSVDIREQVAVVGLVGI